MKKKTMIIISILAVLLLLACILPLPKRIDAQGLDCVCFDEKGEILTQTKMSVDGYLLDFLFLEDRLDATVDIDGSGWEKVDAEGSSWFVLEEQELYGTLLTYRDRFGYIKQAIFYTNFQQDTFCVRSEEGTYVMSTKSGEDLYKLCQQMFSQKK